MTGTAQVLGALLSAAAASGDGSAFSILKYVVGGLGFLLAGPMAIQAISEFVIAVAKITNPIIKAAMPRAIGWGVGAVAAWAGLDSFTAASSGAYLSELGHLWNQTPWAMDLELKLQALEGKKVVEPPQPEPVAGAAPKLALLLALGACLLAGRAHADYAFWNSASIGGNVYERQADGSFSNNGGGVLAADDFALGWGSMNPDGTFYPYLALLAGAGIEVRNSENFFDLNLGLGTQIPGTPGMLVVGPAKRTWTGKDPGAFVALNVTIAGLIKSWKK
jgi:hypothetical protein